MFKHQDIWKQTRQILKEYEGKYNFRSTYNPTAKWGTEHAETNVEGYVEDLEI